MSKGSKKTRDKENEGHRTRDKEEEGQRKRGTKRTRDKENEGQRERGTKRGLTWKIIVLQTGQAGQKKVNESSRIDWLEEVGRGAQ